MERKTIMFFEFIFWSAERKTAGFEIAFSSEKHCM